jgi:hypothetical protein
MYGQIENFLKKISIKFILMPYSLKMHKNAYLSCKGLLCIGYCIVEIPSKNEGEEKLM